MNLLVYKLVIAPLLVALATLAGRRWGSVATGLVAGLPIIAGPILFFYAVEQGPVFASQAAVATLLGMVSLSAFMLIFAWRSWVGGTALSCILLGWSGFALVTIVMDRVSDRMLDDHRTTLLKALFKALVYALAALYLGRRSLPRLEARASQGAILGGRMQLVPRPDGDESAPSLDSAPPPEPNAWDIPLRMLAAALLVWTLTSLAQRLGPRLGGLLTPFPIASTVLSTFALVQGGREAAHAVIKGFFLAFYSFAVFCAVLAASLPILSLPVSFTAAVLMAALAHGFVLRRMLQGPLF